MKKHKRLIPRSMIEMNAAQAQKFLLKAKNYCNIDIPKYFEFSDILSAVEKCLATNDLKSLSAKPRECEGINYPILSNKDGRHAWRPFQLIHPAIYVACVKHMTDKLNWSVVRKRLRVFDKIPNIKCLSLPREAADGVKDKAEQILNWWNGIEQASIELSIDYNYAIHADIADCYSSIYTHSIAWAIHNKDEAKNKKTDKTLIGNVIDGYIQDMRYGQTNGIPQGSVLMDLVAELVLGYADLVLNEKLHELDIANYRILRYRDDYRIFVQNSYVGDVILKALTEVLIDLGLKLNASKTDASTQIIKQSIKKDKMTWLRGRQNDDNLQKQLLLIHSHGVDFPNAGSLMQPLLHVYYQLTSNTNQYDNRVLISIVVDIAYNSPRVFPICAAITSLLLHDITSVELRGDLIQRIYRKLSQLPNTSHMELWLQRISHPLMTDLDYKEGLCQLVKGNSVQIWNNDWINSQELKAALNPIQIVDREELEKLNPLVEADEIRLFVEFDAYCTFRDFLIVRVQG